MKQILDLLYPHFCQLCGSSRLLTCGGQLCEDCEKDVRLNLHACQQCALPMAGASIETSAAPLICGPCMNSQQKYNRCWSPFIYAQPLEWMIQQLKFNAKLHFAPLLSHLLTNHLRVDLKSNIKPDVVIPMPLHPRRLKQRGFNQSYLLIKPVASALGITVDNKSCKRVRNTAHQTGKNARQRQQNIKQAFSFDNKHGYQHVVIFDDVVTTGSTVNELSRTLKQAGVQRVDVWCLARAEKIN